MNVKFGTPEQTEKFFAIFRESYWADKYIG